LITLKAAKQHSPIMRRLTPSHSEPLETSSSIANLPEESDSQNDELITILTKPNSWKLGALIGQGAFGKVYQGLVPEKAEIIAVKEMVLPQHMDAKAEQQLKAFKKEEQLLKKLKHPNIVTFLGSQQIDNKLYIFLEYVCVYVRERERERRSFFTHTLTFFLSLSVAFPLFRECELVFNLVVADILLLCADT
jgi:hypothetical protein